VVLPTFLELFVELRVELPLATRAMIGAQRFFAAYWPWLAGLVVATAIAFALTLRSAAGRYELHRALLATPLLGRVVTMIEMSRFSHNFGLLYGAGVPILRALEMVGGIAQNLVVREALARSGEAVRGGAALSAALADTGALPPLVLRMLGLGERTGALDQSLAHAAAHYDRELPVLIDRSLALFNAAMIAGLGVLLATIALGIFVPLYQMMGQLNETP
jgi:type IV pilus assembly protein PilC